MFKLTMFDIYCNICFKSHQGGLRIYSVVPLRNYIANNIQYWVFFLRINSPWRILVGLPLSPRDPA